MHIKQNNCTESCSHLGRLEAVFQLFWQHYADVALLDSAGSVLFLFLSPLTAEQQNNIIHCVATCKIPLPTVRAPGPFPQIKFLVYVGKYCMAFPDYLHRWSGAEITVSLNQQIAVTILYMCAHVKVPPSSYNYRQMHHVAINGNSCSRNDCEMVISCGDLQRAVTRQISLFLKTTAWPLTVTICTRIRKWIPEAQIVK